MGCIDPQIPRNKGMSLVTHYESAFWQIPGVVWKHLPLVPYESYSEYKTLLDRAIEEYSKMINHSMGESVGDSTMRPWSVAHCGLPGNVTFPWIADGRDIFLKLTKGEGFEWCELMNSLLVHTLDTAARMFVYSRVIEFGIHHESEFEEGIKVISELLDSEVKRFMHGMEINPMGSLSLRSLNFIFYRNFYISDDIDGIIPTGKFQDIMAAFAMGRHPRLGEDGCIGMLDDDLIKFIFNFDNF